jgi:hypothetical protein
MTIITPTGITGITSITSSGNSLSFQNASGASIDVSGLKVAADSMNVSGIVTASRLNVGTGGTIISTTVNGSVGIGTTNPLTIFDARGVITAGSTASTAGSEIIRGYYTAGALSVFGSEASTGASVIGYAVKPSTSGIGSFFSSTSINIARGAYVVGDAQHRWYNGVTQTVAENSPVTMSEVMRINSSGYLGIGTNNPSTEFEVFGTGTVASFRGTGGSGFIGIKDEDDGTFGFIGVDGGSIKLQTSGSSYADKLVVDSSGMVTKPYQPFVAGGAGSASVSGNNNHVWAKSGYVFSNRGNHWNASTGRFTAPVDGVYYVSAGIRYSGVPVTPSYVYIYFAASYQTASGQPLLLWSTQTESGGTYRPRILTAAMYMRANDYVEPRLYVTGGTISLDEGSLGQNDSFLNIYLLG